MWILWNPTRRQAQDLFIYFPASVSETRIWSLWDKRTQMTLRDAFIYDMLTVLEFLPLGSTPQGFWGQIVGHVLYFNQKKKQSKTKQKKPNNPSVWFRPHPLRFEIQIQIRNFVTVNI